MVKTWDEHDIGFTTAITCFDMFTTSGIQLDGVFWCISTGMKSAFESTDKL